MTLKFKIPEPYEQLFTVEVQVSADGIFYCTLPEAMATLFEGKIKLDRNPRGGKYGHFRCNTLDGLRAAIQEKIKELCSEREISCTKVIRFGIETACSYAKATNGDLLSFPGHYSGLDWHGGTVDLDSTHRAPYGLQIYAHVFEKKVFKYEATGQTRLVYQSLREHNYTGNIQKDPIQWLDSLTGLSDGSGQFDASSIKTQEMPYTEEAGWFFVGLFKWLFSVNERIKPFLNPKGIATLAASAGPLRLMGGSDGEDSGHQEPVRREGCRHEKNYEERRGNSGDSGSAAEG